MNGVVALQQAQLYTQKYARPAMWQAPVPVATRAAPPFDPGATLTDGTALGGTAKVRHQATNTCAGLQLAYSNWYGDSSSEVDGPNNITVACAIMDTNGILYPGAFNGQHTISVAPGQTVVSDPIGCGFNKGDLFYSLTYVVVTTGQKWPLGGFITSLFGEGSNYGNPAGTDLTVPGSSGSLGSTNANVFGPSMILGRVSSPGKAVVGIIGDSIAAGTFDSYNGWPARLLIGHSHQKVAFPGESLFGVVSAGSGVGRSRRMAIFARAGVTDIIAEHGVNSLYSGISTATTESQMLTYWTALAQLGATVRQTTITPETTSTDSWATVNNQTASNSGYDTARKAVNAWLRDGAPILSGAVAATGSNANGTLRAGASGHPLTGVIEIADLAESARDSGKWKAGYTSDGIHPNATGAAAIAAALNPVALFGPASV